MIQRYRFLGLLGLSLLVLPLQVQAWNPVAGDWSKTEQRDIRVMTWNVEDMLCSSNSKTEGFNNWCAAARIVASMQPDILLIQEAGDNSGNGTGSGVDTVPVLTTVVNLFLHGGNDPFKAGNPPVTSWVQKYAPEFDLPFVFVTSENDGFNRNIIASRFPFADLNGDGKSTLNDIHLILGDAYAPGGDGGIRGFQFVELDLPNGDYSGDLVVGNAHLKSGGSASDLADRLQASQNVAYWIDYLLNGAGSGFPDPNGRIIDSPVVTTILHPETGVILGGDWNEDELTNGRRGPAEWLSAAAVGGGTDGTDRDRSDMIYDSSVHVFTGNRSTQSSSKLDYLAWQDSIIELRLSFVFNTSGTPTLSLPAQLNGFVSPGSASGVASDHRPVIADFILQGGDCNNNGIPDENETDTDGDGLIDDCDGCPLDPAKVEPGQCGCGIMDVDSDGDGTADCLDLCPVDPNKTVPGQCGCGTADTDGDSDGVADCNDNCAGIANPLQEDDDGDQVGNACDNCPFVPNPTQSDSDSDQIGDACDGCPNDPNKMSPGICGCGVSDADSDGDSTPDCFDACPDDPNKISPGVCGCGASESGPAAPLLAAPPENVFKNRYISFLPNNQGVPVAFKVFRSSPTQIELGWVGAPLIRCVGGTQNAEPCSIAVDCPGGACVNNGVCRIVSNPVVRIWDESILHVGDCEVIPAASYELIAQEGLCDSLVSLELMTADKPSGKYWGDVVGSFNGSEWSPPNGFANVQDVQAILAAIGQVPGAPALTVCDLASVSISDSCLNGLINVGDLFMAVRAVSGDLYPFHADPLLCPECP